MTRSGDQDADSPAPRGQARFEALLALALLAFGLLVLPALIYVTGTVLLGAYGGGKHLGSFYGDFARNLGEGSARAWLLALGPYLLVLLGRLVFFDFRATGDAAGPSRPAAPPRPAQQPDRQPRERREPTLKL